LSDRQLTERVRSARQKDPFADLDNDRQGETVICHTKDIVLYADLFTKAFGEMPKISGLNDIIRYDIHPFLRKMADPVEEQLLLTDGQIKTVHTNKVYHINYISHYKSTRPRTEELFKRMRLVLTRKGIKRMEHISL
jgi:hypothetical protein